MAPSGGLLLHPGLTRAVRALAARAQEEVVVQQLLPPGARWQGGIAVGDESFGQAVKMAVCRDGEPAAAE